MRGMARGTGRIPYAAATALAVMLLSALAAGPARANHTETCEFIDGVRVCIPDEHTPPTVNAGSGSVVVNEGQMASNTGTFSDPDGNATVALSASVGTVTKDDANGTWSWSFGTSDGPDESRTVTITASDGADTTTTTFSLGVNNVAPAVTLQNSFPSVQEGGSFALGYASYGYNLSVSDPGNDTQTLNTGCGSNGSEWQESSFTVWCGFFDGPATGTVSATATDSDGASRTANVNVSITNRDPVAVLNAPASINEGGTATISLAKGNFNTQDGQADTTAGFHYAFDCNGGPLDGATYASSGTAASTNCTFDDNGAKSVRARIVDKDGGFTEYTRTITVNNVAPTAAFEAPVSVDQGGNFPISLSNVTDPSGPDGAALSYAFDCGDGPGYIASGAASKGCTALDRPNMTVRGKVTDKDGGTNEYARTVSVNNVAPTGTVRINGGDAATNNATVRLALSAADPLPGSGVGHMRFRNENTETWSAWEPYSTGRSWLLSDGDGAKTVHVEYRDNAGNVSTAAIEDGILLDSQLDTVAPDTTIASGPTGVVNLASASFGFSSDEAGAGFECRLNGGAFAACSSPKGYNGLSNGFHSFSVRAKDAAGNVDATPAVRTWTVDRIRPTISGMSPGLGSVVRDTTPTIRATVKDNRPLSKGNIKLYVAGREISPAKFTYSASTGLLVYTSPRLAKGKKTVKVGATDGAGNTGTKSWYFTIK